jgi:hypothetical protein
MTDMAESAVRVVASPTLSEDYDRRYVVVDAATGAVIDDAQGYGYKTAQNAHRAHAYKSVSPAKKRQRVAIKKSVRRRCVKHSDFMGDIEQAMFYAMKDGDTFTEADRSALLKERSLETPFTVKELMRHW